MELLTQKKQNGASSTQKYVDVEEIREGVMILKNGSLRSVLLVSSINFDLKSSQEQDAIIFQYQNFLNSLDFPVEVLIQSRRFDVAPYIERLKLQEKQQTNELLKFQISEYLTFIKGLVEVSSVVSKYFYIIVPFATSENDEKGLFAKLSGIFNPRQTIGLRGGQFEAYRSQLHQRVAHIAAAMLPLGVKVTQLNTEELIELLYNSYNPSLFAKTEVKNVEALELAM